MLSKSEKDALRKKLSADCVQTTVAVKELLEGPAFIYFPSYSAHIAFLHTCLKLTRSVLSIFHILIVEDELCQEEALRKFRQYSQQTNIADTFPAFLFVLTKDEAPKQTVLFDQPVFLIFSDIHDLPAFYSYSRPILKSFRNIKACAATTTVPMVYEAHLQAARRPDGPFLRPVFPDRTNTFFARKLFSTAQIIYHPPVQEGKHYQAVRGAVHDLDRSHARLVAEGIFHPAVFGSGFRYVSEKVQCLLRILVQHRNDSVYVFARGESSCAALRTILSHEDLQARVSPDLPVTKSLSPSATVILFDFLPIIYKCRRYILAEYSMKAYFTQMVHSDDAIERSRGDVAGSASKPVPASSCMKTLHSGDALPKRIRTGPSLPGYLSLSDEGTSDAASNPSENASSKSLHSYVLLSGEHKQIKEVCKSKKFIVSIQNKGRHTVVKSHCNLGHLYTLRNLHLAANVPVLVDRGLVLEQSKAHALDMQNATDNYVTLINSYVIAIQNTHSYLKCEEDQGLGPGILLAEKDTLTLFAETGPSITRLDFTASQIDTCLFMHLPGGASSAQKNSKVLDVFVPLRARPAAYVLRKREAVPVLEPLLARQPSLAGSAALGRAIEFQEDAPWQKATLEQLPSFRFCSDLRLTFSLCKDSSYDGRVLPLIGLLAAATVDLPLVCSTLACASLDHAYATAMARAGSFDRQYDLLSAISCSSSSILCDLLESNITSLPRHHNRFAAITGYIDSSNNPNNLSYIDPTAITPHSPLTANCTRTVTVTPLAIRFSYQQNEESNRVLRAFDPDKFIRVNFEETNGGQFDMSDDSSLLNGWFRSVMADGLQVATRRYFFVGMSSSQLKHRGAWFVAPYSLNGQIVGSDYIRSWIGDMLPIRNVSKHIARIGMAFTSTTAVHGSFKVAEVDDVYANGYCFSDGIGLITLEAAKRVSASLKLEGVPSAFQIRYAGYKGVLSVIDGRKIKSKLAENISTVVIDDVIIDQTTSLTNNISNTLITNKLITNNISNTLTDNNINNTLTDNNINNTLTDKNINNTLTDNNISNNLTDKNINNTLTDNNINNTLTDNKLSLNKILESDIIFRKSMHKFNSTHNTLEIVAFSKPAPLFLNKQVIMILEGLGIDSDVFVRLHDDYVIDQLSSVTLETLKSRIGNLCGLVSFDSLLFRKFIPLLAEECLAEAHDKCRIPVPGGRTAIGVLDETGLLGPEEVFLMYSINDGSAGQFPRTVLYGRYAVPVGSAVVFKNPCIHPGDVRVVMCVDRPELHHLHDVIVFSQKGHRPVFHMCSGSDLDGDTYSLCWNPLLVPPAVFKPYHYRPVEGIEKDAVLTSDVISFYLSQLHHSSLGTIACAHMAAADRHGIFSREALQLSELFNLAVDVSKTGRTAEVTRALAPTAYPDFMQNRRVFVFDGATSCQDVEVYRSEKALGRLFRRKPVMPQMACECSSCLPASLSRLSPRAAQILSSTQLVYRQERTLPLSRKQLQHLYCDLLSRVFNVSDTQRGAIFCNKGKDVCNKSADCINIDNNGINGKNNTTMHGINDLINSIGNAVCGTKKDDTSAVATPHAASAFLKEVFLLAMVTEIIPDGQMHLLTDFMRKAVSGAGQGMGRAEIAKGLVHAAAGGGSAAFHESFFKVVAMALLDCSVVLKAAALLEHLGGGPRGSGKVRAVVKRRRFKSVAVFMQGMLDEHELVRVDRAGGSASLKNPGRCSLEYYADQVRNSIDASVAHVHKRLVYGQLGEASSLLHKQRFMVRMEVGQLVLRGAAEEMRVATLEELIARGAVEPVFDSQHPCLHDGLRAEYLKGVPKAERMPKEVHVTDRMHRVCVVNSNCVVHLASTVFLVGSASKDTRCKDLSITTSYFVQSDDTVSDKIREEGGGYIVEEACTVKEITRFVNADGFCIEYSEEYGPAEGVAELVLQPGKKKLCCYWCCEWTGAMPEKKIMDLWRHVLKDVQPSA